MDEIVIGLLIRLPSPSPDIDIIDRILFDARGLNDDGEAGGVVCEYSMGPGYHKKFLGKAESALACCELRGDKGGD